MQRNPDESIWRSGIAAVGTCGYWLMFRPDWRNPALLCYDVPTLLTAWSFCGVILHRVARGHSLHSLPRLLALILAGILATGAQFRGWPLSGHLTIAVTVGVLEGSDRCSPRGLRLAAQIPIVCLLLIRTFWPQMPPMAKTGNTVRGLVAGGLLGGGSLLFLRANARDTD